MKRHHFIIIADAGAWESMAIQTALLSHYPEYECDSRLRTRISVLVASEKEVHDFAFKYQELLDNSYWRIIDLKAEKPTTELHHPQYEGRRKDFVDVEWEFITGHLSHPMLQEKIRRWAVDPQQLLGISIGYDDAAYSREIAELLKRRLPSSVKIEVKRKNPEAESEHEKELMEMAKYLHYFYQTSYQLRHVPTELPEDEVRKAWDAIKEEQLKLANIHNVMSIPVKMEILGHDRDDWDTFYALTAEEIEKLTATEHNRWTTERLIQGMRPCTDQERTEIEEDLRMRLSDAGYAKANPISLKKRYKEERNAHYDLCAYSELGVDETGLPVTRYDRDLVAAIPLIVKTFNDRHCHG